MAEVECGSRDTAPRIPEAIRVAEKKFNQLKGKIEREYEKEGYSKSRSEYIGRATAGKVYREKEAKKCPGNQHCVSGHCAGNPS